MSSTRALIATEGRGDERDKRWIHVVGRWCFSIGDGPLPAGGNAVEGRRARRPTVRSANTKGSSVASCPITVSTSPVRGKKSR